MEKTFFLNVIANCSLAYFVHMDKSLEFFSVFKDKNSQALFIICSFPKKFEKVFALIPGEKKASFDKMLNF